MRRRTRTAVLAAVALVAAGAVISPLLHALFTKVANTGTTNGGSTDMRMTTKTIITGTVAMAAAVAVAETRLQGAGATFPAPLYGKMVAEYQKVHPDVKIDYQSIGSGGGIKAITEKTVCFAGSDAPMKKDEIEKCGGPDAIVQVPSCAGAVVPAYNLSSVKEELKFTGPLLADIFAGKVTKWNDAAIAAVNEGVKLPDLTITPVARADASGTTSVWTHYLCTQSAEFKSTIGQDKQVKWPVGQTAKGNEGVSASVQSIDGTIGYIELNYAIANKITFGSIKNKAGKFVKGSLASVAAAGGAAADSMNGTILAATIWDTPGEDAYACATFTYLIVRKNLDGVKSKEDAQALVDFLWWATHDGQKYATELQYAPLAKSVQEKVEKALSAVTFGGEALNIGR
jgi:phosphate transport system substrate-binding protein